MLGPPLGSLIGSFIDPSLGWRWIVRLLISQSVHILTNWPWVYFRQYWVLAILAGLNTLALQFFLQETYHPVSGLSSRLDLRNLLS